MEQSDILRNLRIEQLTPMQEAARDAVMDIYGQISEKVKQYEKRPVKRTPSTIYHSISKLFV
jgi:hypothetical protein